MAISPSENLQTARTPKNAKKRLVPSYREDDESSSKKRPRPDNDQSMVHMDPKATFPSQESQGARPSKSARKGQTLSDRIDDGSPSKKRSRADCDESMRHMDPSLLADHISKKTKRLFRDLSSIELEEKYLSQSIFHDTSGFSPARDLESLPSFLQHFAGEKTNLSSGGGNYGSPHTLCIAASGLRAADVTRSLRRFRSDDCAIAKLFAKHIKITDAINHLNRTRIGIGVGTPQRLLDLLDQNALKTSHLKHIVIDASHLDQKKRSIFDMKELLAPLTALLSHSMVKDRLAAQQSPTKVLAF